MILNGSKRFHTIFTSVIAALGGLLFGYDTGVISGAQLYYTKYFQLTPVEQGWAVSCALYGCLVGAGLAGFVSARYSRKYALIISAFLFSVSALGSGAADSLAGLSIYRIIGGLGVGMASMAAPIYIAEISPAGHRGRMVSLYQLAVVVGFFLVFLVTYFIGGNHSSSELPALHDYNLTRGWRLMFWSEIIPAVAFFLLLFNVDHSPRWLILKSRYKEARRVLAKSRFDQGSVSEELEAIKSSIARGKEEASGPMFSREVLFVLFLGVSLAFFQQITGINAILYYGAEIFSTALGYGPEDALKQQLWLGGVNLLFTFVAIFTVDRWGRKPLMIAGVIGMFIGLGTLSLSIYYQQLGVVSLVSLLVFIGSFALSLGPVVWVVLSEIFPNRVRSLAMSIAVGTTWLVNGVVANSFPVVNQSELNLEYFRGSLPYMIFAGFCILALWFIWFLVPETNSKTLEEIESFWKR